MKASKSFIFSLFFAINSSVFLQASEQQKNHVQESQLQPGTNLYFAQEPTPTIFIDLDGEENKTYSYENNHGHKTVIKRLISLQPNNSYHVYIFYKDASAQSYTINKNGKKTDIREYCDKNISNDNLKK